MTANHQYPTLSLIDDRQCWILIVPSLQKLPRLHVRRSRSMLLPDGSTTSAWLDHHKREDYSAGRRVGSDRACQPDPC